MFVSMGISIGPESSVLSFSLSSLACQCALLTRFSSLDTRAGGTAVYGASVNIAPSLSLSVPPSPPSLSWTAFHSRNHYLSHNTFHLQRSSSEVRKNNTFGCRQEKEKTKEAAGQKIQSGTVGSMHATHHTVITGSSSSHHTPE
jgi:hypothetical protein